MTRQPFEEYLALKDEAIHAQLVTINDAIAKGAGDADAAIKWKQYMYSFDAKWMDPICTIDTTKKGFVVRFMDGEELSDPLGVLRFASSSMGSWDIPYDEKIRAADITKYVSEAAKIKKSKKKEK